MYNVQMSTGRFGRGNTDGRRKDKILLIFYIDNTLIIEYNKIKQKRKAAERLEGGKYEIRRNDDGPDRRDHEKGRRSAPETEQSGC